MDGIMKASRVKLAAKDPYVDRFCINVRTSVKQVLAVCGDSEKELVSLVFRSPRSMCCMSIAIHFRTKYTITCTRLHRRR